MLRSILLRRLTAGNERRQPFNIAVVLRRVLLRTRLVVLRLVLGLLRLVVLRLRLLRLALVERLCLRGVGLAAHLRLVVAVIVAVVNGIAAHIAGLLLLVIGLVLAKLFLGRGDQAEIMFGVLIIIFGGNWISGALRVAGELEIFLGDVRSRSPNFYVLPVGLVHS